MLPSDHLPASLPDPIPASYYARPARRANGAPRPALPRPALPRLVLPAWRQLLSAAQRWPAWRHLGRAPGRWSTWRDLRSAVRDRPYWEPALVTTACLVGALGILLIPWKPALGLVGLAAFVAVVLVTDAWGMRSRTPLLGSANRLHAAAGWAAVTALFLLGAFGLTTLQGRVISSVRPQQATAPTPGPNATRPEAPTAIPVLASPSHSPTASPSPSPRPSRTPTPSATPPEAIAFLNAPLAAHRNQPVTLRATTAPGTSCSISIEYESAPQLDPATSTSSGAVSWTWRVSRQAPVGVWPIRVACGSRTATTQITLS